MVVCSSIIVVDVSAWLGEYLWLIVLSWVNESSDLTIYFTTHF